MILADFLGWSSQEWTDTIGLVVVFFVGFPLLAHGLIAFAAAQGLGERRENEKHAGRWGRRPGADS
jgi:hypothetical protein